MNRRRQTPQHAPTYLYCWLLLSLFLEYARPASFFPFLNIPFLYSAIPLLLFAVSFVAPGLRPMKDVFQDRMGKWLFILIGLVALSWVTTFFSGFSQEKMVAVIGYGFVFLLVTRICTTIGRVRGVVVTLLAAHVFLLIMNPAVLLEPDTRHYIVGATFLGDGNDFGLSLCILVPCAIELALSRERLLPKILYWVFVAVILLAIIGTQSRGATLGIAAILGFMWWNSAKRGVGLVAVGIVAMGLLAYAPSAYFQRMGTIGSYQTDGSAQGRLDAWKAGLGMALHNPVLGVGAGHFGPRWGKTAHSSYVLPLAELGVPGLFAVLMLVIGNMRDNMRLRRRILEGGPTPVETERIKTARLLILATAAMLGFAVAGAFLSATYYPHLYILTGLLVAVRYIAASSQGIAIAELYPVKGPRGRRGLRPATGARTEVARTNLSARVRNS